MKPMFNIGDRVLVRRAVIFKTSADWDNHERLTRTMAFKEFTTPRTAIVVGGRFRFTGKVHPGGYDDPGYLEVQGTQFVYQVREGFINKPLEVLPQDLVQISASDVSEPFPFVKQRQQEWSERAKQELREAMKDAPRDSKGRWVQC